MVTKYLNLKLWFPMNDPLIIIHYNVSDCNVRVCKVKDIVRDFHRNNYRKLTSDTQKGIHGDQTVAYKILKYPIKSEKDKAKLSLIREIQWIKYPCQGSVLWCYRK